LASEDPVLIVDDPEDLGKAGDTQEAREPASVFKEKAKSGADEGEVTEPPVKALVDAVAKDV